MYLIYDDEQEDDDEEGEEDVHSFLKALGDFVLGKLLDDDKADEDDDKEDFTIRLDGEQKGDEDPDAEGEGGWEVFFSKFWSCDGCKENKDDADRGDNEVEDLCSLYDARKEKKASNYE